MPELQNSSSKKIISFYLPQFHRIPENDLFWGKGFTEWTNTKKARPLFEGHYQPREPLESYYDLNDVIVMEKQSELALKYGVYGFCYYHYWFKGGKKLLEKPIEQMLNDKKVTIPFCLCWANENWTRNWDGGDFEIIQKQEYGKKTEWKKHFDYLLRFFKDERYILYNGCPLIIIYKPEEIVLLDEMIDYWRKLSVENGFKGLVVLRQTPGFMYKSIDFAIKFQPACFWGKYIYDEKSLRETTKEKLIRFIKKILVYLNREDLIQLIHVHRLKQSKNRDTLRLDFYDDAWDFILNKQCFDKKLCSGSFTDWDNTPRNVKGQLFVGADPKKFEKYIYELLLKDSGMNCIFLNAWNEWGEGAYLEPDKKFGFAYLNALEKALNKYIQYDRI